MAKVYNWTSIPIGNETTVDASNNQLDITFNSVVHSITIDEVGYMSSIIRHESRIVEEIKKKVDLEGISLECKIGIFADGNIKNMYVVFIHEDVDTFSYDGTFKTLLGDIQDITVPVEEVEPEL